jgi:D-arabinose 1-dehydrogenase-like Zn-dependent alcohol dehydrogenase
VTKIPRGSDLTWVEMASLVCAGVTAWNALFGNIPMRPEQTVLFQGKSSRNLLSLSIEADPCHRNRRSVTRWSCAS